MASNTDEEELNKTDYLIGYHKTHPQYVKIVRSGDTEKMYDTYNWYPILVNNEMTDERIPIPREQ